MRGRSNEAFWWSIFSAGGVVAAIAIPAMIFITGVGGAAGWQPLRDALSYEGINDLLEQPIIRAVIGVIVGLVAMHAAHRIRHLLIDLRAPVPHGPLVLVSYGAALALIAVTAVFLVLA